MTEQYRPFTKLQFEITSEDAIVKDWYRRLHESTNETCNLKEVVEKEYEHYTNNETIENINSDCNWTWSNVLYLKCENISC